MLISTRRTKAAIRLEGASRVSLIPCFDLLGLSSQQFSQQFSQPVNLVLCRHSLMSDFVRKLSHAAKKTAMARQTTSRGPR